MNHTPIYDFTETNWNRAHEHRTTQADQEKKKGY